MFRSMHAVTSMLWTHICRVRCDGLLNFWPQISHWQRNGEMSVCGVDLKWFARCFFTVSSLPKDLWQMSQKWCLSPRRWTVRKCLLRWWTLLNFASHSEQSCLRLSISCSSMAFSFLEDITLIRLMMIKLGSALKTLFLFISRRDVKKYTKEELHSFTYTIYVSIFINNYDVIRLLITTGNSLR